MPLPEAPERLIAPNGLPTFGVYQGAVPSLNLSDFDFTTLRRGLASRFRPTAGLYLKRWHYTGFVHPSFVLGLACVDLGYVGNLFAYLYERETGALHGFDALLPAARGIRLAETARTGRTQASGAGIDIEIDPGVEPCPVRLRARGRLSADLTLDPRGFTPLSCITRIGLGGFNYTHKASGLPAAGHVEIDGRRIAADGAFAVVDFTAGVPARETFWNWASGCGRCESGKRFGINLVAGINETGFTENVFWLDGKPEKLDVIHFDYDRRDLMQPWRLTSADGKLDLTFKPEGSRSARVNALLIASDFHQPFGAFSGTFRRGRGKEQVSEGHGFVEEHFARW